MPWFNYDDNPRSRRSTIPEPRVGIDRFKVRVRSRRVALLLSYGPDWAITLIVGGLFFILGNISGYKREFSLTDTTIQHTYAVHERISVTNLGLIAIIAPLVIMPLINLLSIRSFWDWHHSWLGVICSCAYTGTATNIVKVTVGRPRPDLIDRCQPIPGAHDAPVFGLVNESICTQTDRHIFIDGWKSFFSGHSSLSFAGLGFLSFYLAGKLHLFDKRGHAGKAWLALAPLAGASLVAISRTMDNRHHWQDVLVGAIVGLLFAFFSYRQYYPPLTDRKSHLPYRPRIDHDILIDPILPLHENHDDTGESTHGLHPVSPGGHYTTVRRDQSRSQHGIGGNGNGRERDDSSRSDEDETILGHPPDEPDRTVPYDRGVDPPLKAHTHHVHHGVTDSVDSAFSAQSRDQNLVDI